VGRVEADHMKHPNQGDLIEPPRHLDEYARKVIEAALTVHRHLGPGFPEGVYEEALVIELAVRGISFQRQLEIPITYNGHAIARFQLDLLVEDELVVELKAVESLHPLHRAQVISYLRAGRFQLGLLINFNVFALLQGVRRVIWNNSLLDGYLEQLS